MSETEIPQIELERIRPSARNPRKTIDPDKLANLAASINVAGVTTPIEVFELVNGNFEIIEGERRWRAAKLAGLDRIPTIVKKATEESAFHLRLIAFTQREDIHPLEEADAYAVMLDGDPKAGIKSSTVNQIAVETGKTPGQIYARLKLRSLSAHVRKAYLIGKVTTATAQKLARLVPELQSEALAAVAGMTDAQASDHLLTNYTLSLGAAPFDTTDSTFAGGACEPCQKRTGNQPLLFPDVKRKDTCTDPVCFKAKTTESYDRKLAAATKAGAKELPASTTAKLYANGDQIQPGAKFVDLDALHPSDPKVRTWRELIGEAAMPKRYVGSKPSGGTVELVKTSDAWLALEGRKDLKWAKKGAPVDDDEAAPARDDKGARAKKAAAARAHELVCEMVLDGMVAFAEKMSEGRILEMMVEATLEDRHGQAVAERRLKVMGGVGDGLKGYEASRALRKRLPALASDELRGILAETLIGRAILTDPTGKRETLKEVAKLVGLDLTKIEKQAKAQASGGQKDADVEARAAGVKGRR